MRAATAAAVAAASLGCAGLAGAPAVVSDGRYAMGTVLEITLVVDDAARGRALLDDLFRHVAEIEGELSTFVPGSAVSALNARAGAPPAPVPPALEEALRAARTAARETGGAFDVSVGPLLAIWREAARADRLPDPEALRVARERVGGEGLVVTDDGRAGLARPGMAVDLGGLGKGFALDRVAPRLEDPDVRGALLSFGGSSFLARGRPPGGDAWRLLLRGGDGAPLGTVALRDTALSVSESLGQWSTIQGERYGHVVDPRTGQALREGVLAVVASTSATRAEVWSTALLVLGAPGLAHLEAPGEGRGLLLDEDGKLYESQGFRDQTGFAPQP